MIITYSRMISCSILDNEWSTEMEIFITKLKTMNTLSTSPTNVKDFWFWGTQECQGVLKRDMNSWTNFKWKHLKQLLSWMVVCYNFLPSLREIIDCTLDWVRSVKYVNGKRYVENETKRYFSHWRDSHGPQILPRAKLKSLCTQFQFMHQTKQIQRS